MTTFAFNTLVQPSATVTQTLPSGLDPDMTYLLASATDAAVQLYMQGLSALTPAMLAALPLVGKAASYQQIAQFTASEALGLGETAATSTQPSPTPGAYVSVTIGIALAALDAGGSPVFTVIALRGTQTYQEWVNDVTAVPQSFALVVGGGYVHSGFYTMYTTGTNGLQPATPTSRAAGSLAYQVDQAVNATSWPTSVPLYITGHSLGAALAELCALDLASNDGSRASAFTMVNFAPPRASAGLLDDGSTLPLHFYDPTTFMQKFQSVVPDSYSVVNAADLVPIMPPTLGSATGLQVVFYGAVASGNVVTFCAQLGDVASNHELTTAYLPYAQQLAGGFQTARVAAAPACAPRARIHPRATAPAAAVS